MAKADFRRENIVRHTHTYSLDAARPADVVALAEKEADSFWGTEELSKAAALFSDTVTKVGVDDETGEMYAFWTQAGAEDEIPFPSSANTVTSHVVNLYLITADAATSRNLRAVLDEAERDAKEYADANNLEFHEDIIAITHNGDDLAVIWSTESDA